MGKMAYEIPPLSRNFPCKSSKIYATGHGTSVVLVDVSLAMSQPAGVLHKHFPNEDRSEVVKWMYICRYPYQVTLRQLISNRQLASKLLITQTQCHVQLAGNLACTRPSTP